MNPRTRSRMPASIGSNQASPANKDAACAACTVVLSSPMAWSPPARQRRSWLVEQAGDYATLHFPHPRDGTIGQEQCPLAGQLFPDRFAAAGQAVIFPFARDLGNYVVRHADRAAPVAACLGRHLVGRVEADLAAETGFG